ncbi:cilia- and flagella-associated protein 53-like [Topomyia yanbarensis]|uniref:cilia- and flagella-associated protein 53-like n=1 Tax=Topomyia yanbarensis TaxID=2498891 RepID=UPI00273CDB85|nr:cilia- and flagella-associated protein 53-like [Topomyia yanbarensis]
MNIFYPEINIKNEVKKLMDAADQAYDQYMAEKRKRLKALLQAEEIQQQKEVLEILSKQQNEQLREKQNALLAAKQDKERQREEFLKNKMIQLKIQNCDEIRTYIQQKYHEESKRCQLAQIADKQKQNLSQLDEDRLWQKVQQRSYELQFERELEAKRKRMLMEENTLQEIQQQIKERSLKAKQEKAELQEACCTSLLFSGHDNKLIQIKKSDLAVKLREQIVASRALQMKRDNQERDVVKTLNEGMQRELDSEKAAREAQKRILKEQIDQHHKYSKQVQKQRQIEEAKHDKLIHEARQESDKAAIDVCKKAMQKRWGLADKVYDIQRQQIAEMEDQRRRQREQKLQEGIREREMYEQYHQATVEADNRAKLEVKKYREMLNEQIKSSALEKEHCKRHDQMQSNKLFEANKQELDFVQTYVKGSFETHFMKHPNISLLRKKH